MPDSAPGRAETQAEDLQVVNFPAITFHIPVAASLLSLFGWILCIISIGLTQWRVWHVDNTTVISSGIVWIGIWDICFTFKPELGNGSSILFCQEITTQNTFIPSEVFVAQDLLILAIIIETAAVGFTFFALWSVYKKQLMKHILFFFLTGGLLNIISGVLILIPVIWNLYSIMKNHSIAFPPSYHLPSSPKTQKVGAAIPVGFVSVLLLFLSGFLLICDRFLILANKVHPTKKEPDQIAENHRQTSQPKGTSARSSQTYPHCGSCLEIDLWGPPQPFGSGIHQHRGPVLVKNQAQRQKVLSDFRIPTGPFPCRPSKAIMPDCKILIIGGEVPYF